MSPWVRRGILVGALAGVGIAVWKVLAGRTPAAGDLRYTPQPFPYPPRPEPVTAPPPAPVAADGAWVAPDDGGGCPLSHPIKGKVRTGIYHPPGAFAYDRTHADRCYRDAAAAESDGLRAAKR